MTAHVEARLDLDGKKCALLKIYCEDKIIKAQGNVMGEVVTTGMENLVYLSQGTKQVRLIFEKNFPLMITFAEYEITSVAEGMVYEIKLVDGSEVTSTPSSSTPSTDEILAEAKKYYDDGYYGKAMELFKKIDGDKEAQYYIGLMFDKGQGVSQDSQEAGRWYRKAAAQGYARAQNSVGDCFYNGEGVHRDYQIALKWYRKAAEQENADAQCSLGYMYDMGYGVSQDDQEAVRWYRKAAEQGNSVAQYNLGSMYYDGRGVGHDSQEAVRWYRKAAEQGDEDAKKRLKELGY